LSVTYDRSVVFSGYSGFLHWSNRPPRYNWNIFESDVKHHMMYVRSTKKLNSHLCVRFILRPLLNIVVSKTWLYACLWINLSGHVQHTYIRMKVVVFTEIAIVTKSTSWANGYNIHKLICCQPFQSFITYHAVHFHLEIIWCCYSYINTYNTYINICRFYFLHFRLLILPSNLHKRSLLLLAITCI
jgi:hypothetical protein